MKTNNVLTRPMGDLSVNQRTKDGYFNATDLIRQWKEVFGDGKSITEFINEELTLNYDYIDCGNNFSGVFEDGVLWLNEEDFRAFINYLSPELLLVEYPSLIIKDLLFGNFVVSGRTAHNESYSTYIIKDASGLFKIGKSKNIERRIKALQTSNPTIELVLTIEGDIELNLHEKYAALRVKGEWFKLSELQINEIKQLYNK